MEAAAIVQRQGGAVKGGRTRTRVVSSGFRGFLWLCAAACASRHSRPTALYGKQLDNNHTPYYDVMILSDFLAYHSI